MQRLEDTSTPFSVGLAIVGYSLCSSTLLLANKMALYHLKVPSIVSLLQLVFATVVVLAIKGAGYPVDWFDKEKMKAYSIYVVIFIAAIYTNMKALEHSNVETVIVFRALSPLAVSMAEFLFMDRELPSLRSSMSLCAVSIGAIVYCISDSQFSVDGIVAYSWVILYFFLITAEMTYGKKLTSSVKMDSVWGPVLYCNALSVVPMFLLAYAAGDCDNLQSKFAEVSQFGWIVIIFSCVVGTLIGYTGWLCRGMVSATTYTLVGVVNKFLTVLLNVVVWDKHSTPIGIFAVCICLLSGSFYQQAPRRELNHKEMNTLALPTSNGNSSNPLNEEQMELLEKGKEKNHTVAVVTNPSLRKQ